MMKLVYKLKEVI